LKARAFTQGENGRERRIVSDLDFDASSVEFSKLLCPEFAMLQLSTSTRSNETALKGFYPCKLKEKKFALALSLQILDSLSLFRKQGYHQSSTSQKI